MHITAFAAGWCAVAAALAALQPCAAQGSAERPELPVEMVVTALEQSMDGYTTFQVSAQFNAQARDVYALFGEKGLPLTMPPAWHLPTPFGTNVGPPNAAIVAVQPDAAFDSFVTLGVDGPALVPGALSTVGLDFDAWSETTGMMTENGAVFFMDPEHGATAEPVVIAQLTMRSGTHFAGAANCQGRSQPDSIGNAVTDWEAHGMTFSDVPGQRPPPPPLQCRPGQAPGSVGGTTGCVPCPTGTYSYDGSRCNPCSRGWAPNLPRSASLCIECRSNQILRRGAWRCEDCPEDQNADRWHERCIRPPPPPPQFGPGPASGLPPPPPPGARWPPAGPTPEDCHVFWQEDELPQVHQLNLEVSGGRGVFDELVHHSTDRSYGAITGSLQFNDAHYEGVELEVHGGNPQRGRTQHSKPSFRLEFSKDDPFSKKHGVPWSYPKHDTCNNVHKMVLRGEWNDAPLTRGGKGLMIRNKITQDILKKAGAQTPREAFAVLNVCSSEGNCEYFGFYGLEEHVDKHWFECQGWDVPTSSLYKANGGCSWREAGGDWEQKLPHCPEPPPPPPFTCGERPTTTRAGSSGANAEEGAPCHFPFEYKSHTYNECSTEDNAGTPWCNTEEGGNSPWGTCVCASGPPPPPPPTDCAVPDKREDLGQLFGRISRLPEPKSLRDLSTTLNITDFFLWQMTTVLNMNIDTGSHNYYIHGPTINRQPLEANELWRVISIDSDWGWGYDYGCYARHDGGNGQGCGGDVTLEDDDGVAFTAQACAPFDDNLFSFYCGNNRMTSVLGASEENKGWYFAAFKEFLRQPFTAACALTGAVDLLMGPNGVLSEYLQRDSDHWNVRNFDLEREVKYIKGWMRTRVRYLNAMVDAACEANKFCKDAVASGRPQTCRAATDEQMSELCAQAGFAPGSATPTKCKQGSEEPQCVVDTDPCASAPCLNGGECQTEIVAPEQSQADACGCTSGTGWSGSEGGCAPGKLTNAREGEACISRRAVQTRTSSEAEELRWLSFSCDCSGGWGGALCEVPRSGADACGCALGSGWSKSRNECKEGGTTTSGEAAACAPTPPIGGGH